MIMLYICLESLYRKRCEQQMVSNRQGLCLVGVQYAFSGSVGAFSGSGGIHILHVATPRPGMEVLSSQKCWSLKPLCLKPISLAPFHFQAKVTFVCERNVCFGFKQVSSLSLSCQEHSCTRLILNLNTLPHQRKPQWIFMKKVRTDLEDTTPKKEK